METHNRKNMPNKDDINFAKKGHESGKKMEEPSHEGHDYTTGRGMHGSKGQGGNEFDREKEEDKFDLSERKDEIEEDLNNTGQGSHRGGSSSANENNELKFYSGSVQHRARKSK